VRGASAYRLPPFTERGHVSASERTPTLMNMHLPLVFACWLHVIAVAPPIVCAGWPAAWAGRPAPSGEPPKLLKVSELHVPLHKSTHYSVHIYFNHKIITEYWSRRYVAQIDLGLVGNNPRCPTEKRVQRWDCLVQIREQEVMATCQIYCSCFFEWFNIFSIVARSFDC